MLERYPNLERCEIDARFPVQFILHNGIGNKLFAKSYLGEAIAGVNHKIGGATVPRSYQYICPFCGWIWAEIVVQHPGTVWDVWRKPCSQHGWGSMLSWVPQGYDTYEYPTEILEHELELMLSIPEME